MHMTCFDAAHFDNVLFTEKGSESDGGKLWKDQMEFSVVFLGSLKRSFCGSFCEEENGKLTPNMYGQD